MIPIDKIDSPFEGKRITVFSDRDNQWHAGVLNYICNNIFPSHGVIAFFGRKPIFNININKMFEYETRLDYILGTEKYTDINI